MACQWMGRGASGVEFRLEQEALHELSQRDCTDYLAHVFGESYPMSDKAYLHSL